MSQVCQYVPYNFPVVLTQRVPSVGITLTTQVIPAREGTTTIVTCVPVVPDGAVTTTAQGGQPPRCIMSSIERIVSLPGGEAVREVPFTITVDRLTTTISTGYSNSCNWVPVPPTTTDPPPWTPPTIPPTWTEPTFTPPTPAFTATTPPITSAPVFRPNSVSTGTTSANSTSALGSGTGGGTSGGKGIISSGSRKKKGKKLPTGGLAGGAVAGLVLLVLLLYTAYVWLRNRRKKAEEEDESQEKNRAVVDGGDVEELESARDTMMTRASPYSAVPTQSPDDIAAVRRTKAEAYGPMTSATTLETQPFFGRASTTTDSIYSSDRGSMQPGPGPGGPSPFYGSNFAGDWDPYQALQAERNGQARKIEEEQRLRGPVVHNPDPDGAFRETMTGQGAMHGGGPVPMGSAALYYHSVPHTAPLAGSPDGMGHLGPPSLQHRPMGAASPGPPPIYPGTPEI